MLDDLSRYPLYESGLIDGGKLSDVCDEKRRLRMRPGMNDKLTKNRIFHTRGIKIEKSVDGIKKEWLVTEKVKKWVSEESDSNAYCVDFKDSTLHFTFQTIYKSSLPIPWKPRYGEPAMRNKKYLLHISDALRNEGEFKESIDVMLDLFKEEVEHQKSMSHWEKWDCNGCNSPIGMFEFCFKWKTLYYCERCWRKNKMSEPTLGESLYTYSLRKKEAGDE